MPSSYNIVGVVVVVFMADSGPATPVTRIADSSETRVRYRGPGPITTHSERDARMGKFLPLPPPPPTPPSPPPLLPPPSPTPLPPPPPPPLSPPPLPPPLPPPPPPSPPPLHPPLPPPPPHLPPPHLLINHFSLLPQTLHTNPHHHRSTSS